MKLFFLLFGLLLVSGCTHRILPHPMKEGMVGEIKSQLPLEVVNIQKLEVVKIEGGIGDNVNLRKSTDDAISLFKSELQKKGIEIRNDASRTLGVSVDKVVIGGFWVSRCTVFITAETGDGFQKTFNEYNLSGVDPLFACQFAVTKAVALVLNNKNIHNYITDGISSDSSNKE
jgi:hypothetical protein